MERAAFVTMRREIEAARGRNAANIASLRAHALAFERAWPFPMTFHR